MFIAVLIILLNNLRQKSVHMISHLVVLFPVQLISCKISLKLVDSLLAVFLGSLIHLGLRVLFLSAGRPERTKFGTVVKSNMVNIPLDVSHR